MIRDYLIQKEYAELSIPNFLECGPGIEIIIIPDLILEISSTLPKGSNAIQ